MEKLDIRLKNIEKAYTTPVLRNINLEINNDSYITILGKSGSGKSTLMNIIGLVEGFDKGEYWFNDRKIQSNRDYAKLRLKNIGFIFQSYNLVSTLTCRENIMLPLLYARKTCDVNKLADSLGIGHLLDRQVNVLSGGEKQRIAIARALVLDPALIIADEPTGNLDKANRECVFELLKKEHEKGRAILMITHDRDTAEQAKVKYYLEQGELNVRI